METSSSHTTSTRRPAGTACQHIPPMPVPVVAVLAAAAQQMAAGRHSCQQQQERVLHSSQRSRPSTPAVAAAASSSTRVKAVVVLVRSLAGCLQVPHPAVRCPPLQRQHPAASFVVAPCSRRALLG